MNPAITARTLAALLIMLATIGIATGEPPTTLSSTTADVRAAVDATFASDDRSTKSEPAAGVAIGATVRHHPDWSRAAPAVPESLATTDPPGYYIAGDTAIALALDASRIAVRVEPNVDPRRAAAESGVEVLDVESLGFDGWHIVEIDTNAEGLADHLRQLADAGRFGAPIFANPEVEGGWLTVTTDLLVRLQPDTRDVEGTIARLAPDFNIIERDFAGLPGAFRLRSTGRTGYDVIASANALALHDQIAWAEPEMIGTMGLDVIPDDPGFENCWGLHNTGQQGCCIDVDMDGPEAWDIVLGQWDVRVLVMDTGIEYDHPDLNAAPGRDFTTGEANGSGDGTPVGSCDDHGTAVAGCISARINNGLGTVGIAPASQSISARIARQQVAPCSSSFALYSSAWVANAINWGYGQGIPITNASFTVSASSAIQDAYADTWSNGVMHFASAGNDGDGNLNFPSSLATVHAVAAIGPNGGLTSFSNWGSGLAFAAPGTAVYTTDRTGSPGYSGSDYTWAAGTSFASPYAAGAAALLWSAFPDYNRTVIEFWLQAGATDLGSSGYDTVFGWGIPNPRASLNGPGPFNNFCANSWPILVTSFAPAPFDTSQATAFPGEPQEWCELGNAGVSNSVWFAFYAPCDAVVDINTNGSTYDTVLSLWVGACDFAWPVACDDDGGTGLDSQLDGVAVAGDNIYMIKVADYDTTPEGGMLDFHFVFRQPNDACLDAIEIGVGTTEFCTLGATESGWQPNCAGSGDIMYGDVWFTHVATQTGQLDVWTCGFDDFDTKLAAYEELNLSSCPAPFGAQLVACNDDASGLCSPLSSRVTIDVVAGVTYTFRVGGEQGPAGSGHLNIQYESCQGDANGDGVVDVEDLLAVLNAWNTNEPATDFNGDGVVDVDDLLVVLVNYGACP